MIRCMAVLTISLLLTVSCSGGSDTETARVPASVPTAQVASPTSAPTQVPPSPTPTQTPPPVTTPRPIPEGILAVNCEDKNTHIYCLSTDLAVPPETPNYTWGTLVDYSPEIFCGSDVPEKVCQWTAESLVAAFAKFGFYGPTEYWVIGAEIENIVDVFCTRRVARGHKSDRGQCISEEKDPNGYKMEFYRSLSAELISTNQPRNSAALSGDRGNNYNLFYTSLPPGFMPAPMQIPAESDQTTIFHEAYHAYQHSFIQTMDHIKRGEMLGPTWWNEGTASYIAEIAMLESFEDGTLKKVDAGGNRWPYDFKNKWKNNMEEGLSGMRAQCSGQGIKDLSHGNQCASQHGNAAFYTIGGWAVAYLYNKHGPDAINKVFYENLESLGWEGAFVKAFGMSSEAFYTDFDKFLELALDEQVAILPQFN